MQEQTLYLVETGGIADDTIYSPSVVYVTNDAADAARVRDYYEANTGGPRASRPRFFVHEIQYNTSPLADETNVFRVHLDVWDRGSSYNVQLSTKQASGQVAHFEQTWRGNSTVSYFLYIEATDKNDALRKANTMLEPYGVGRFLL